MTTENTTPEVPEKPKIDGWTVDRIKYLRGLKSPNQSQMLLILLFDKTEKTDQDYKSIGVLVRNEKTVAKVAKTQGAVLNLLKKEKAAQEEENEKKRRARNHGLVELGLLFQYAEIESLPRSELVGMLLDFKNADAHQRKIWSEAGAAFFASKEVKQSPAETKLVTEPALVSETEPVTQLEPVTETELVNQPELETETETELVAEPVSVIAPAPDPATILAPIAPVAKPKKTFVLPCLFEPNKQKNSR